MSSTPSPAPLLDPSPPAEAVAPLMRGLAVLRCLGEAGGTMGIGELERATGLARATLDRVAATLARIGYVRVDGRDARLAPRVMELGNAYLSALRLPALLGPHAEALADTLDESVSLAVGDGDGIRFIHQTPRRRTLSLSFRIGDLLPAERTAPGPLFAAEWAEEGWVRWRERRAADPADLGFTALPPRTEPAAGQDLPERADRARRQGWALDDQLIEPGLVALAVPVRDPEGRIACVASVVSHTSRHGADSLREAFLPRLREAVEAMEHTLATAGPAPGERPAPSGGPAVALAAAKREMGREFIESLARGLAVITAFGEGRAELPLTAVAEATGLARATARRALITLEHLGYVTTRAQAFALTPRVLALGFPPLSRTTLPAIARPHLAALAGRVREAAYMAVLTGDEIQCTASGAADRIMRVDITAGTRLPAYCTASGRVLLADLPAETRRARLRELAPQPLTARTVTRPEELAKILDGVRSEGYALVDGEMEEGLCALAVPLRDGDGDGAVVAAVAVALHTSRRTPGERLDVILPELRATASAIESDLRVTARFTRVPPR